MSFVEYNLIFLSIVFGLIVVIFFSGWSRMIRRSSELTFSSVHFIWSIIFFIYLGFRWVWDYKYHMTSNDSASSVFATYLFRPLIIYFSADVLFPPEGGATNYKEHMLIHGKKFYKLAAILWTFEIMLWLINTPDHAPFFGSNVLEHPRFFILINMFVTWTLALTSRRAFDLPAAWIVLICTLLLLFPPLW
jgi:hypothetical protein